MSHSLPCHFESVSSVHELPGELAHDTVSHLPVSHRSGQCFNNHFAFSFTVKGIFQQHTEIQSTFPERICLKRLMSSSVWWWWMVSIKLYAHSPAWSPCCLSKYLWRNSGRSLHIPCCKVRIWMMFCQPYSIWFILLWSCRMLNGLEQQK